MNSKTLIASTAFFALLVTGASGLAHAQTSNTAKSVDMPTSTGAVIPTSQAEATGKATDQAASTVKAGETQKKTDALGKEHKGKTQLAPGAHVAAEPAAKVSDGKNTEGKAVPVEPSVPNK